MKRTAILLALVAISAFFLLTACTTVDVEFREDFFSLESTGDVSILLSRAVPRLTVLVDNRVVLDGRLADTRRVDILNVPEGSHEIRMFADSWKLKENFHYETDVRIRRNETTFVTAIVPQFSTMYWIYIIGMAVASSLPTVVVHY